MLVLFLCLTTIKQDDHIYIYFTGDVHCAIEENIGYSSLSAFIKKQRQEHKYVTLLDLGDFLQDNAKNSNEDNSISSLTKGKAIINLMNAVGYDIVTIGNHEFDFGIENMIENLDMLNAEITVCNFEHRRNKNNPIKKSKDYIIKDYGGIKIAYIGVTSPEASYKVNEEITKDGDGNEQFYFYGIDNGKTLYSKVQSVINLVNKQVDYVVLMSHLGTDNKEGYSSLDLIKNTYGIDVLLDSHSHTIEENKIYKNKYDKDVYYCSTGKNLENIGKLVIGKNHVIDLSLIKGRDEYYRPVVMDDDEDLLDVLNSIKTHLYGMNN